MSIGIDLANPEGIKIIKKLIKWADVIIESFAPGIMEGFGLGYEDVKKIKPDVIFLRTNMLGATGPRASMRGFGFQLVGYTGFTYITGWPDRTPVQPFGPYTDSIAPRFAASALIMALLHKRRTGEGVYIDLSQHEAGIQFLQSKGIKNIVIIAHSLGTTMTAHYLANNPASSLQAFVAVGMPGQHAKIEQMNNIKALEKIKLPLLDIFGGEDLENIRNTKVQRANAARRAGNTAYTQLEVPAANHFFNNMGDTLVKRVRGWLAKNAAGTEIKK